MKGQRAAKEGLRAAHVGDTGRGGRLQVQQEVREKKLSPGGKPWPWRSWLSCSSESSESKTWRQKRG